MVSGTTTGGCEFSSFSSGSKVRARREMPTSGPVGFPQRKASFGGALSPRKRLSYSLRPAFEDATDGKEKNHASAVCRDSRSLAHLSSTVLDPHCYLRPICCSFFSRLSHDEAWWLSCALWRFFRGMGWLCGFCRIFIGLSPEEWGPTLPTARMWPTAEALLSLQSYVSNWYPQINMSAKQQNREPAKQYVSKTTKQCVNTTAKQQNRDFSQSVLQSVSASVSISVSQY